MKLHTLWVCTNMYANFKLRPLNYSGAISRQHISYLDLYIKARIIEYTLYKR